MMPPWRRPKRIPWQLWIQRRAGARGCDGSRLMDGDEVYVVTNRLKKTLQRIDYFHGSHEGWGPIAQMHPKYKGDEYEDHVFAFEMFAIHRGGKVIQSIIYIQRAWRKGKRKADLDQSNQDKIVVKRKEEMSDRSMPRKKRRRVMFSVTITFEANPRRRTKKTHLAPQSFQPDP